MNVIDDALFSGTMNLNRFNSPFKIYAQPEVYSSRTGHMPKAPTCTRPGVNILGIIYTPAFKGWDGQIQ
mgnify:CR=1 FL=1